MNNLSSFLQGTVNISVSLKKINFAKKYFHTVSTLNLIGMPRARRGWRGKVEKSERNQTFLQI